MKRLALIAVLFTVSVFSQERYVFEGTIGKNDIYLFFDDFIADDGSLGEIRYFYKSQLKDIVLQGRKTADGVVFFIKHPNDDTIVEQFTLARTGDNFKGYWQDKSKKHPVTLKLLSEKEVRKISGQLSLPDVGNEDLIRGNFLKFKLDSVSKYKSKNFEWYSEVHCSAPFIRLGDNFPDAVRKAVNPVLEKMHYEMALWQLTCNSQVYFADGSGIDFNTAITYLDDNLIGLDKFSYWYCGGAHPDGGSEGILLDLHSGKRYEIDDMIAFDATVTTEAKGGFEAFSKYRRQYFGPILYKLIDADGHFEKRPDDNNCDYSDLSHWTFAGWRVTEKGIEFEPSFPHASQVCSEGFLVPFNQLERYRHPKFPYVLGLKK